MIVAALAFISNKQMEIDNLLRYLDIGHVKGLYAAALGIEILCIAAAEIGENTGLYLFGVHPFGIITAYAMGHALAGFTTFITHYWFYYIHYDPW